MRQVATCDLGSPKALFRLTRSQRRGNFNKPPGMLRMGPKGRRAFRSLAAMCSLGCFLCDLCAFAVRLTPPPPRPRAKALGARDEPFRNDRRCVRCLSSNDLCGIKWLEAYPTCLSFARSLGFAGDKKSEFPRIGIYAEESFRAECPRFALEGTSETRCFAIGFCKSTKQ